MILVIDDNREFATVLARELRRRGHEVETAHSGHEGLALVAQIRPKLILLDVRLTDMSGLDVLTRVRTSCPDVDVVIMTAYPELASALAAIKGRVVDYLCKPFTFDDLDGILRRVVPGRAGSRRQIQPTFSRQGALETEIVGASTATAQLRALIAKLAAGGMRAALIAGESGTGKDLVARMLHAQGPRRSGPFVAVNCSAIVDGLFESEFFGHERGAFTGAVGSRRGLVEVAHGGTLFLDEVSEMSRVCQAKLLRFLDDQSFRRVGGSRTIRVDVQIIAATNHELETMVREQAFRADLYFRLNVAPVRVVPLRERPEDILPLATHFLNEANTRSGKHVRGFTARAAAILLQSPWPGNVRELRNLVERLVILCPGDEITDDQFPAECLASVRLPDRDAPGEIHRADVAPAADTPPEQSLGSLEDMERAHIRKVLAKVAGNKTRAAEILGISRQTLRSKIASAQ